MSKYTIAFFSLFKSKIAIETATAAINYEFSICN